MAYRLELPFRESYTELAHLADGYLVAEASTPIAVMLWSMRIFIPTLGHQTVTNAVCAELGIPPVRFS